MLFFQFSDCIKSHFVAFKSSNNLNVKKKKKQPQKNKQITLLLSTAAVLIIYIWALQMSWRDDQGTASKKGSDGKHNGGLITSPPGPTAGKYTEKIQYDYLPRAKVTGNGA